MGLAGVDDCARGVTVVTPDLQPVLEAYPRLCRQAKAVALPDTEQDVVHEAIVDLLSGALTCPPGADVVAYVMMRAKHYATRHRRVVTRQRYVEEGLATYLPLVAGVRDADPARGLSPSAIWQSLEYVEAISPAVRIAERNARKTHCPAGHPYSEENTYRRPNGGRVCRICNRRHNEATRRRRGEQPRGLKPTCGAGHAFDEGNTYVHRGRRRCRACKREADRRAKARRNLLRATRGGGHENVALVTQRASGEAHASPAKRGSATH